MIRSSQAVTKVTPFASHGMVVAAHPLGAEVGAAILKRGGNAVDAAVATAFAMTVAEPFMSTIAGGGTMLVHLAKRGETVALDFNVQAPAACHESVYPLEEGLGIGLFTWRKVVGDANMYGHKSVAVRWLSMRRSWPRIPRPRGPTSARATTSTAHPPWSLVTA
ncbi:MAG: ggt [candidate division NC10 bacterium]|nr:ggt [candidate division NC10 bacterium]